MSTNDLANSVAVSVICAVAGMAAICFGSMFVIGAPGDGQTGMVAFPLWIAGAALGVFAIVRAVSSRVSAGVWITVVLCAVLAIWSVVRSFVAAANYQAAGQEKKDTKATD